MRFLIVSTSLATLVVSIPAYGQHSGHGGPPRSQPTGTLPAQTVFEPQASPGEVRLSLAPRWSDGRFVLLLAANADSVDLSQIDLQQAVRLVVNGSTVAPVSADSLKGHHSRARIVFPLATAPQQFTIEIRGVPDVNLRVMHWPAKPPSGH